MIFLHHIDELAVFPKQCRKTWQDFVNYELPKISITF